jgi:hypothetical protein
MDLNVVTHIAAIWFDISSNEAIWLVILHMLWNTVDLAHVMKYSTTAIFSGWLHAY